MFDMKFPSSQLINKTDLAKYDSTWNLKPWWIAQGAQKNFTKFADKFSPSSTSSLSESEHWDLISPEFSDDYYQNMVSIAILWKYIESMISDARGDWYEGDYRAQITAYTVSKLFHTYREMGAEFDLKELWRQQAVPSSLQSELPKISILVQHEILHPPLGKTNVGEWTKQEECWNAIRVLRFGISKELQAYSISKSEARKFNADAKKAGQLDDEIRNQSEVGQLVAKGFFAALIQWSRCRELFTPNELALIGKAASLNGFSKINKKEDWKKLLEIKSKSFEEGFRAS
jgi:hypothetical protein